MPFTLHRGNLMETANTVREYIEEFILYGDSLDNDDASLIESGMVDSTGAMELISFLESTFSIQIPNNEISPDRFDTVNLIASYVDSKLAEAA